MWQITLFLLGLGSGILISYFMWTPPAVKHSGVQGDWNFCGMFAMKMMLCCALLASKTFKPAGIGMFLSIVLAPAVIWLIAMCQLA